MTDLLNVVCEACRIGSPHATAEETTQYLAQLPGWNVFEKDGAKRLGKKYEFANFVDALSFVNRVAEIAEEKDHHPDMLLKWGEVTVTWWTHKIDGLHLTDFVCAARTEEL